MGEFGPLRTYADLYSHSFPVKERRNGGCGLPRRSRFRMIHRYRSRSPNFFPLRLLVFRPLCPKWPSQSLSAMATVCGGLQIRTRQKNSRELSACSFGISHPWSGAETRHKQHILHPHPPPDCRMCSCPQPCSLSLRPVCIYPRSSTSAKILRVYATSGCRSLSYETF